LPGQCEQAEPGPASQRKRPADQCDYKIRRRVQRIKRDANFLNKPRYQPLLHIYAGLVIKYETLLANITEKYGDNLVDELGRAVPALDTL
jgi:hypothetical protein